MLVTVCVRLRLDLPGVNSLKEKRRIIKSLMAKVRHSFNVSIAEVDENDALRTAALGAAVVANRSGYAYQVMAKMVSKIEQSPDVILMEYHTEIY